MDTLVRSGAEDSFNWWICFVDQNDEEEETKEEKSFAETEAVEQDEG